VRTFISFTFLLVSIVFAQQPSDHVFTLRVEEPPGSIELSTVVAISPSSAVTLAVFHPSAPVSVETPSGVFIPESIVVSQDLGLYVLTFEDDVFPISLMPSDAAPPPAEPLVIVGQGLSGLLTVEGITVERYPDGAILVSAPLIEGLMGAAVFDSKDRFVGIITGVIEPDADLLNVTEPHEYLVLYPTQIWYMWAQLASSEISISSEPFGVTAMSSISLSENRPSGIQLISVIDGSEAWNIGFRPGDLVTRIDDTPVYHPETLRGLRLLSEDTLTAVVWCRNGERTVFIPPSNDLDR